MDPILLFFVLPLATIVFSVALESILNNPFLVASIIFSIFLIITFTLLSTDFLIYAILYTIISFITAYIYCLIIRYIRCLCCSTNLNSFNKCICQRRNNRCSR